MLTTLARQGLRLPPVHPTPVTDLQQGCEAHPAQQPGLVLEGTSCSPASLDTSRHLAWGVYEAATGHWAILGSCCTQGG